MNQPTPYELKSHDFRVTIRTEQDAEAARTMLDRLINIGLEDATDTVENDQDESGDAADVIAADFHAPVLIGDTDLIPITLRPTWTERDGVAALQEGWDIFYVDGSYHDIQRVDEPEVGAPVFASDAEAIAHVFWRASAGSALHRKALAICMHATNHPPAPRREDAAERPTAPDTNAGTYRVEVTGSGTRIVCRRGAVCDMTAGAQGTREQDAARIVQLLNRK